MLEVELQIPDSVESEAVLRIVEQVCASKELTCSLKATLVSYAGNIHWHFRRGKQRGTLEITGWESEQRLGSKLRVEEQVNGYLKVFPN